ncbi:MAG TPA: hypothetical protein VFN54_10660 [Acidimicrobiales bacterium]|nr:hypothetical protein [Acidimicrobiales bacterium]
MRGHLSGRVRALSSWAVAGTLTLVLSTAAVALMMHASNPAPLSNSLSANSAPTTVPNTPAAPPTMAPAPAVVTYTYSGDDGASGDDGSPSSGTYGSSASGSYGDD